MTRSCDRVLPILKIRPGEVSRYALVCGDPGRTHLIAGYLDAPKELAYNREYRVVNGEYAGVPVTVASHGVGAAGACVCFEELIAAGARVLIRVGTAGSLQRHIVDGDIIVATAAAREDGVTQQLVPLSFPAVAAGDVVDALCDAASRRGARIARGVVVSVGAFYPGLLPLPNAQMSEAGAVGVEMEAAALFIVAALRGARAGAILAVDGMAIDFQGDEYNPDREVVADAVRQEALIALDAMAALARRDREDEGHARGRGAPAQGAPAG